MDNPLVSIIIPCFNQADFLEEALNSVAQQTYQNWECIIVNDGSTDDTKKIALCWAKKDVRFVYLEKPNGGLSSARNLGLNVFKGGFVQFLDADDYLSKDKLELSLNTLNLSKKSVYDCAISNFKVFFQKTCKHKIQNLNPDFFNFESILYHWDELITIPIHCGFFKADFFKEFRFQGHIRAKEDWIMWVSFFKKGYNVCFIDKPLAAYRKHNESMTMTKSILPQYVSAYQYMKTILTENEFDKLSVSLFSKYYNKSIQAKIELVGIKSSNSYRAIRFLKKMFSKLKIFKPLKYFFELCIKLKDK